jgi:hypothetical protein
MSPFGAVSIPKIGPWKPSTASAAVGAAMITRAADSGASILDFFV